MISVSRKYWEKQKVNKTGRQDPKRVIDLLPPGRMKKRTKKEEPKKSTEQLAFKPVRS